MFDLGWGEMLVIAIVVIVVVGPKELPGMLRTFGKTTSKLRVMANDFRRQFDDALKEAELDGVKQLADDVRSLNPKNEIRKALSPMEKAAQDVRAGLDAAMKPDTSNKPAASTSQPAEPVKAGAAALPGEAASSAAVAPAAAASKPAAKARATTTKSAAAKAPAVTKAPGAKAPVAKATAAKAQIAKTAATKTAEPRAAKAKTGGAES